METNGMFLKLHIPQPADAVTGELPSMHSAPVDWLKATPAWRAVDIKAGDPECLYPVTLVKAGGPIFLIHSPDQGSIWLCVHPNGCDVGILVVSNQQCVGFVAADGARLGWIIQEAQ